MGRDLQTVIVLAIIHVSIHAPAWGATRRVDNRSRLESFNPRARMGRDESSMSLADAEFRSTRPHGARQRRTDWLVTYVSIHAPAWGATAHSMSDTRDEYVSIHAPAWGATTWWMPTIASFNPRARMGRDYETN